MVVQISVGVKNLVLCLQNGSYQFFGSCFSVTACNADVRNLKLPSRMLCQLLYSNKPVFYKDGFSFNRIIRIIDYSKQSSFSNSFFGKFVSVEIASFKAKKQAIFRDCSRIRLHS